MRNSLAAAVALALAMPTSVYATNAMNLDGYGAIARGMGGAGLAYDNGLAGVMNNPATLALMPQGHRVDLAVGFLGPNVETTVNIPGVGSMAAESGGDAYWMPGMGWGMKQGQLTYGVGVFAQGGMGTEYESNSPLGMGTGDVRSELSVGRLIFPLAFEMDKTLSFGATLEYVWAGLDLKMAMPGPTLGAMVQRGFGAQVNAPGTASGSMINAMVANRIQPNWARFDFSDDSDFTGEAQGDGFGGKLGMVYTPSPGFNIGLAYHSQIKLGDLETDGAKVSMDTGTPAPPAGMGTATITGNMKVKDFKWPDMFGIGMSYQMNKEWMLAADIKYVRWADALKNFSMSFTADSNPMNGPFGGAVMDATLYQDWDDIVVVSLGASLQATPELTVRGGMSFSQNPIPDQTMNYLFPAIPKTHISAGLGYQFNKQQSMDFAFVYALEEEQTNPGGGYTTTHSQINWELMYSHRF